MKTGRNNNNSGFSLVELIVVVAVIAIVAGGVVMSASVLNSRKLGKCAEEMVSSMERARVLTLGKEQNAVECIVSYNSADSSYHVVILQGGVQISDREIGKKPIEVKVYFDNETTGYSLENISGSSPAGTSTGLHVIFNRSSGAFVEKVNSAGGTVKNYCTKIEVTNGTSTIEILPVGKTGKITSR